MVRKQEGRSHTALRGMSGSTHTVLRRSIHPETHTHTDQFNIPPNNCRNHRLNCLQIIYCSSWTTVQLSPSLLCSVSYCLLRTKPSLKPCTPSKAFQPHDESNTQSIALLTFNEICVQLRTLTAYVPVTRCALCVVYCVPSSLFPSLPPSFLPSSLSLAQALLLPLYLLPQFALLSSVKCSVALCGPLSHRFNSAVFWGHLDAFCSDVHFGSMMTAKLQIKNQK